MGSISPPQLRRIPVDAPIEDFIDAIKIDGGCICTNYIPPETVAQANAEVKPFLDADKPWQVRIVLKQRAMHPTDQNSRASFSPQRQDAVTDFSGEAQHAVRSSSCTLSTRYRPSSKCRLSLLI